MALSQETALETRLAHLESIASDESRRSEEMSERIEALARLVKEDLARRRRRERSSVSQELDFSGGLRRLLDGLAKETGNPPEVILFSALGLYKIGLEALREGNRLAVVDSDWEPIQEITGISENRSASRPVGVVDGE